jgi:hypothetical protein
MRSHPLAGLLEAAILRGRETSIVSSLSALLNSKRPVETGQQDESCPTINGSVF